MAANNTVEAVLRSKFEDGVQRGIEQTAQAIGQAMGAAKAQADAAAGGVNAALASMGSGAERARDAMGRWVKTGEDGFSRVGSAAGAAAAGAEQAAGRTVRSWKKVTDQADEAAQAFRRIALPVSAALAAGGLAAVKMAGDMEVANVGFTTMLGSAEKAKRFLGELQQFAAATPFQFAELRETASKMLAIGIAAKDIIPTLRAIGDAVAAMGGGQEKIDRVRLALTQMLAKEKVSAEEMMQLAEAGIPAWNILAKAIGVSIPEAMKLAEKGAIDARGAVDALVRGMTERFGGRMDDISKTLKGQFSNLIDNIQATGAAIGERFVPDAKRAVAEANKLLDWAKNAAIEFQKLPEPIRNTAYAITALLIAAGPASIAVAAVTGAVKNLALVWGGMKVVAGVLPALLQYLPPVAAGLAVMWGGNKLIQHAQGNVELNTTSDNIKKINDRLKETPQWFVERGLRPPAKPAGPSMDALLDATQKFDKATPPPLIRVDPAEAEKARKHAADQLEKFQTLRREFMAASGNEGGAALAQLFEQWAKIDGDLTMKGAEWDKRRGELKVRAVQAYEAKVQEILDREARERDRLGDEADRLAAEANRGRVEQMQQLAKQELDYGQDREENERHFQEVVAAGAKRREELRQQEVASAIGAASAIERAIDLAGRGRLSAQSGMDALRRMPATIDVLKKKLDELNRMPVLDEGQVEEVIRLQQALERLNRMNWSPFKKALQAMKEELQGFVATGTDAWAQFWSSLVQGQDGAGKKLLGAFIGMIGQMLVHIGVILIQAGIAEIVLAQTLVGYMAGARVGAGAKAIAAGAVLAAVGGIMQGAAANLAQSSSGAGASSSAGSGGSDVQTARPQQVQIINVGSPKGSQTAGDASAKKEREVIELKLTLEEGIVAKQLVRSVKGNNREVRLAIQRA